MVNETKNEVENANDESCEELYNQLQHFRSECKIMLMNLYNHDRLSAHQLRHKVKSTKKRLYDLLDEQ